MWSTTCTCDTCKLHGSPPPPVNYPITVLDSCRYNNGTMHAKFCMDVLVLRPETHMRKEALVSKSPFIDLPRLHRWITAYMSSVNVNSPNMICPAMALVDWDTCGWLMIKTLVSVFVMLIMKHGLINGSAPLIP